MDSGTQSPSSENEQGPSASVGEYPQGAWIEGEVEQGPLPDCWGACMARICLLTRRSALLAAPLSQGKIVQGPALAVLIGECVQGRMVDVSEARYCSEPMPYRALCTGSCFMQGQPAAERQCPVSPAVGQSCRRIHCSIRDGPGRPGVTWTAWLRHRSVGTGACRFLT